MPDELADLLSLSDLQWFLASHGHPRSRGALTARCRDGLLGRKIGTQWLVTQPEALAELERVRSGKRRKRS